MKKYYILYILIYLVSAFVNTQFQPYLKDLGYSTFQRGFLFAFSSFIGMIIQLLIFWGMNKNLSMKYLLCGSFLSMVLFGLLGYSLIGIHMIIITIILCIGSGLVKVVWNVSETSQLMIKDSNYGILRSMGAIGLSMGACITPFLLKSNLFIKIFSISICSICVLWLGRKIEDKAKTKYKKKMKKNKYYYIYLIMMCLIFGLGCGDQFLVIDKMLMLKSSSFAIGCKWAVQAFMEIPIYLTLDRLRNKFSDYKLFEFAIVMYGIKFILYGWLQEPWGIVGAASLQVVTLPIVMLCAKYILQDIVGEGDYGIQMISLAVFTSIAMIVSPILYVYSVKYLSYDMSLYIIAFLCLFPFILCKILGSKLDNQ